jgi:hypothetical protein
MIENPKISYREFDDKRDVPAFCAIFWEYWLKVNSEDLSYEVEEMVFGIPIKMQRIESVLYAYLARGYRIRLVLDLQTIVGFLIYRRACDLILEVRHFYVEPSYWNSKIGAGCVESLNQEITVRKIIFQTRKELPPMNFLKNTEGRRQQIGEINKLITWEMEWGHGRDCD